MFKGKETEDIYEGVGQETRGGLLGVTTINFDVYSRRLNDFKIVIMRTYPIKKMGYIKNMNFGNYIYRCNPPNLDYKYNELEIFIRLNMHMKQKIDKKKLKELFVNEVKKAENEIKVLAEKQNEPIKIPEARLVHEREEIK